MNVTNPDQRPSKKHPGRRSFNWSAYDAGDAIIEAHCSEFRGVLIDLGCGERPYEAYLRRHCDVYVGLDWGNSPHHRVADVLADLNEDFPLRGDVADTVVSFSVMEHLREPGVFLREAARIMRPGAKLILQVPFMWRVHEAPYDFFRYTRFGLEYMLRKAGLVDIVVEPTTGFWVMWTLKFNYQLIRLIGGPRLLRTIVRLCLKPVFWMNQHVAIGLDRVWPESFEETAGYFVVARKP